MHRDEAVAYSLAYARDMNQQLASKFIGMYVNEFTRDYGEIGRAAIREFLKEAHEKGYVNAPVQLEFVE
jgi:1,4-dihydroxy-6-naphthoate synthase